MKNHQQPGAASFQLVEAASAQPEAASAQPETASAQPETASAEHVEAASALGGEALAGQAGAAVGANGTPDQLADDGAVPAREGLAAVAAAAARAIDGLRMLRTRELALTVHEQCPWLSLRTVRTYLDQVIAEGRVLRRVYKGHIAPGPQLTGNAQQPAGEQCYYASFAEYLREAERLERVLTLGGQALHEVGGTPDVVGRRSVASGAPLGCNCEIISGELKLKCESLFAGLGQACGYQLFSHAAWLAVPRTAEPADLARLEAASRAHNVGLALYTPEGDPGWEARVRPVPRVPDLAYANAKLARLSELWQ